MLLNLEKYIQEAILFPNTVDSPNMSHIKNWGIGLTNVRPVFCQMTVSFFTSFMCALTSGFLCTRTQCVCTSTRAFVYVFGESVLTQVTFSRKRLPQVQDVLKLLAPPALYEHLHSPPLHLNREFKVLPRLIKELMVTEKA